MPVDKFAPEPPPERSSQTFPPVTSAAPGPDVWLQAQIAELRTAVNGLRDVMQDALVRITQVQADANARVERLEDEVQVLNHVVRDGNGQPSLTSRVNGVELLFKAFLDQCRECKGRLADLGMNVDVLRRDGSPATKSVRDDLHEHLLETRRAQEEKEHERTERVRARSATQWGLWIAVTAVVFQGVIDIVLYFAGVKN